MKIVFDIDGVLRDLYNAVQDRFDFNITSWYWKHKGMDIYDLAKLDSYKFLAEAPTTNYFKVIWYYLYYQREAIFWSHQPRCWRKYTLGWLDWRLQLSFKYQIKYYTPEQKYKQLQKNKNIILVDDFPFFPSYGRIILIDAPYNQKAKAKIRIKTPKQLQKILQKHGN